MNRLQVIIGIVLAGNIVQGCLCITLPPNYGKTQFIIGVTEKELRNATTLRSTGSQVAAITPRSISLADLVTSASTCVLFSPDDNVVQLLIELINHEQQNIRMAAFLITQKTIAQALINAHNRGVPVEIITDQGCSVSGHGKIPLLQSNNIPVYVYQGMRNQSAASNIMHHKFIIFGKNKNNKKLVWTGSFNFTYSAQYNNQENVVIIFDTATIKQFEQQFEILKKRCHLAKQPQEQLVKKSTSSRKAHPAQKKRK